VHRILASYRKQTSCQDERLPMITTVIFDLDDTLYNEVDYCRSGFASVAEHLASRTGTASAGSIFQALWQQFSAGNRTRTFDAALELLGIPCNDDLIRELVKVYREHWPNIALPADSRDVLEQLAAKYTLGLLTDGFLPAQKLKVKALRIERYFKSIIYTEELGRDYWKPSPVGFEKMLQALKAPAQQAVYVADNEEKDFFAPNGLNMPTIQVMRPARIHTGTTSEPAGKAKYTISRIAELPLLLERL